MPGVREGAASKRWSSSTSCFFVVRSSGHSYSTSLAARGSEVFAFRTGASPIARKSLLAAAARLGQARPSSRQRSGVRPVRRLTTPVKWDCELKPAVKATCAIGSAVVVSMTFAFSTRRRKRYSCGRRLVALRNWAAKCMRLRPAVRARSASVIGWSVWLSMKSIV